jgi:DNA-binding transcriptional ArsR family regulator
MTDLVRLLRAAADTIEGMDPRPALADELRVAAIIEQAAADECTRRGEPVGIWWRTGNEPRRVQIRRVAATAAREAGASVKEIARALELHHSTVSRLFGTRRHCRLEGGI